MPLTYAAEGCRVGVAPDFTATAVVDQNLRLLNCPTSWQVCHPVLLSTGLYVLPD